MCTAISFKTDRHFFGRTFDYEFSYVEEVVVTPRNFPLPFRRLPARNTHYAMIGIAYVQDGYPLYYDAVNEHGLGMAGLNFPENARYYPEQAGKDNVSPFEFIPYILSGCATLDEAREVLKRVNLAAIPFSDALPLSPLHWMISDRTGSLTVETTERGMTVYENPAGVLANNPPFDAMLLHLANYMALSTEPPVNRFEHIGLAPYSRGMGAMGLPGDLSSASRFVRAAFVKDHSRVEDAKTDSVSQFFHILGAVEQQRGCVKLGEKYEITIYTSCCDTEAGIYYFTTYGNRRIRAVDMKKTDYRGTGLCVFPLEGGEDILFLS